MLPEISSTLDGAGATIGDGRVMSTLPLEEDLLPVRMLNEFVFCRRLFHLMHVESQWADNAYTEDGRRVHRRVDSAIDGVLQDPEEKKGMRRTPSSRYLRILQPNRSADSIPHVTTRCCRSATPCWSRSAPCLLLPWGSIHSGASIIHQGMDGPDWRPLRRWPLQLTKSSASGGGSRSRSVSVLGGLLMPSAYAAMASSSWWALPDTMEALIRGKRKAGGGSSDNATRSIPSRVPQSALRQPQRRDPRCPRGDPPARRTS